MHLIIIGPKGNGSSSSFSFQYSKLIYSHKKMLMHFNIAQCVQPAMSLPQRRISIHKILNNIWTTSQLHDLRIEISSLCALSARTKQCLPILSGVKRMDRLIDLSHRSRLLFIYSAMSACNVRPTQAERERGTKKKQSQISLRTFPSHLHLDVCLFLRWGRCGIAFHVRTNSRPRRRKNELLTHRGYSTLFSVTRARFSSLLEFLIELCVCLRNERHQNETSPA